MSLNRYENLRRYLHISPLKPIEPPTVPQKPLEPPIESPKPSKPLHKAQEPIEASKLPQSYLDDPKDQEH